MSLLSVLLLVVTLQSPDNTPTSVRVFVFTAVAAPDAPRTPDEQERLAAVGDMREALKNKKGITVVDEAAAAKVHM